MDQGSLFFGNWQNVDKLSKKTQKSEICWIIIISICLAKDLYLFKRKH